MAYRDAIFFASGFAGLLYESTWAQYLKLLLGSAAYAQTIVLAIFMGGMAIGAGLVGRATTRIADPLRAYALVEAAIGLLAFAFHPAFVAATGAFHDATFAHQVAGAPFTAAKIALAASLILPQTILLGATFPLYAAAATRGLGAGTGQPIASLYFANSLGGALGVLVGGFALLPAWGLPGTMASAGAINVAVAGCVLWMGAAATRTRPATPEAEDAAPVVGAAALAARMHAPETSQVAPVVEAVAAATAPGATAPEPPARRKGSKAQRRREERAASAGARADAKLRATVNTRAAAKARRAAVPPTDAFTPDARTLARWLLATAFLTGASSFVYEIGWIRMLSLVLGGATHSFELMLSAFVLGLALGALWIRKRIDDRGTRGTTLAYVQVAMGLAAVATIPLHTLTFDLVAWLLKALPRSEWGYAAFNVVRYGISSLIVFPAAFCAGMTLPLLTRLLGSGGGAGERAIGYVYGVNTLGAIAGVLFAVHVGMPLLGLEYLVAFGALLDVALGAALLVVFGGRRRWLPATATVALCVGAGAAAALSFDPQKLASGVYRSGQAALGPRVTAIAHGKTSTVTIERRGDYVAIRNNGKPDASAYLGDSGQYSSDLATQTILGALPLLLLEAPARVANIGFGSGITGATMLADPRVRALDTIEIEAKVVELARNFDPLNRAVYVDPRSRIHVDDAKSFFASHGAQYDLIVSEPSNPWVSGVANLFTLEFYRYASRHLADGGLFAQWLQSYETGPDRVISVLKAFDAAFDDYVVVQMVSGDLLLLGKPVGRLQVPADFFDRASPELRRRLRAVDVVNGADLIVRIIGDKALLRPWLDTRPVVINSDFRPYLDSNADRDRFLGQDWHQFEQTAVAPFPLQEVLRARPGFPAESALTITRTFGRDVPWLEARAVREFFLGPYPADVAKPIPPLPPQLANQAAGLLALCNQPPGDDPASGALRIAARVLPFLSRTEGREVLQAMRRAPCLANLSGAQAQWPQLLEAIADRDAAAMGRTGESLLAAAGTGTREARGLLLGIATLGHLGAGDAARARAVWDRYARDIFGDEGLAPVMEILRAHALAAPRRGPSPPAELRPASGPLP